MSISINTNLSFEGHRVKLSKEIMLYKGDTVSLNFKLSNTIISEMASEIIVNGNLPIDNDKIRAYMLIEDKGLYGTIKKDNYVSFRLKPEHQKMGKFLCQIVLTEDTGGGEVDILHTPPFPISIEKPIAELGNGDVGDSNTGGGNTGGGNTGSTTNIHGHWVDISPPISTEMIWIDEGIGSVNETIDVLVLQELKEIILNQNKKIDELERKIIALENNGSIIITTDSVLLEDGSPLLMEDGDYLLLG